MSSSDNTIVRLVPVIEQGELVRAPYAQRTPIKVTNDASVILGRNANTHIKDTDLSRTICTINAVCYTGNTIVTVWGGSEDSAYAINDERVTGTALRYLRNNDTVSLVPTVATSSKRKCRYMYRVHIIGGNVQEAASATVATTAAIATTPLRNAVAPAQETASRAAVTVVEDFNCAVCLDIIYKPTVLNPCQHSLCHACAMQYKASATNTGCPTCRQPIFSYTQNQQLETAINLLIDHSPFLFKPSDVEQYKERCNQPQPPPVQAASRKRKARRATGRHAAVVPNAFEAMQAAIAEMGMPFEYPYMAARQRRPRR